MKINLNNEVSNKHVSNNHVSNNSSTRFMRAIFCAGLFGLTGLIGFGCADKEAEEAARQDSLRVIAESQARADSISHDSIVQEARALADSVAAAEAAMPDEPEMPPRPSIEWGTYTVQIASYDSRELAMPFYNKLEAEGRAPYILDETVIENGEERIYYRLRFGKFDSKDEAHNKGSEVALVNELDYWVDNYKY